MNASQKKAFYYHADASALGGVLNYPVQQTVSVAGSVSLASAGGTNSLQLGPFQSQGALALRNAQVSVSGTEHEGSGWRTVVTAIVGGLNIFGMATPDPLLAPPSALHPNHDTPAL